MKCSLKLAEMGYRGEQFCDTNDIWNYFISHQKYMEGGLFFPPNIIAYLYFKNQHVYYKYVPLILSAFFFFVFRDWFY